MIEGKAPAFCHDWKGKHWGAAVVQQGWGKTRSHLRVRTAIDAKTRTAKESQLFAYECRVAEESTRWLADIDLSAIPEADRNQVCAEIAALLQYGLGPIGKTDAWANVQLSTDVTRTWAEAEISNDQIILQLNTPALLIASTQIANKDNPDLQAIYSSIFTELSGESLELSHFYASHDMAGGKYLAKRRQAAENSNYRPYVLTEAGSVFVFTFNKQEAAKTALAAWQRNGLPLPTAVHKESGNDWKRNPYLPQNGYGEIAVNLQHGFEHPTSTQLTPCFGSKHP
ncbi:MAG: hypothetical protein L6Q40_09640 [Azonexus sp.]|nr:hypothetical protein [Azonexus sp.]